jgi:rhamnosyltransferase
MPTHIEGQLHTVGILVVYDQTINPASSISKLTSTLRSLIIVDNTVDGHPKLEKTLKTPNTIVLKNKNEGGLAGAYNRALGWIEKNRPEATHVIFIDDDTDHTNLAEFLASEYTITEISRPDVAAVAPSYVERETGIRATHIQLKRFTYQTLPRDLTKTTEVSFIINSMSLWRIDAIREIGQFSTLLKVDRIDIDYCIRAAVKGFKVFVNPHISFIHSIGKRQKYTFLGKTLQSGGHSPARREMIGKNTVILGIKYATKFPSFAILCLAHLVYEITGIIIAEKDKTKKTTALIKGILIGIISRYK